MLYAYRCLHIYWALEWPLMTCLLNSFCAIRISNPLEVHPFAHLGFVQLLVYSPREDECRPYSRTFVWNWAYIIQLLARPSSSRISTMP